MKAIWPSDPSIVDRAVRLATDRAAAELELIAALAPGIRQGFPMLDDINLGEQHFAEPDCFIIFKALDLARKYPDVLSRAQLVRRILNATGWWDEAESRSFLVGMTWGPGPLAVLFYRQPFDEGRLMMAAAELIQIIAEQDHLASVKEAA